MPSAVEGVQSIGAECSGLHCSAQYSVGWSAVECSGGSAEQYTGVQFSAVHCSVQCGVECKECSAHCSVVQCLVQCRVRWSALQCPVQRNSSSVWSAVLSAVEGEQSSIMECSVVQCSALLCALWSGVQGVQ